MASCEILLLYFLFEEFEVLFHVTTSDCELLVRHFLYILTTTATTARTKLWDICSYVTEHVFLLSLWLSRSLNTKWSLGFFNTCYGLYIKIYFFESQLFLLIVFFWFWYFNFVSISLCVSCPAFLWVKVVYTWMNKCCLPKLSNCFRNFERFTTLCQ